MKQFNTEIGVMVVCMRKNKDLYKNVSWDDSQDCPLVLNMIGIQEALCETPISMIFLTHAVDVSTYIHATGNQEIENMVKESSWNNKPIL